MRNPDGTQDWNAVFEEPEAGLLDMIERCDSPEKLRVCYRIAINGLFSRNSDQKIRETYVQMVEDMYENDPGMDQLPGLKTKVRMIFQRIMHERIIRANAFIRSDANNVERRAQGDDPIEPLAVLAPVA